MPPDTRSETIEKVVDSSIDHIIRWAAVDADNILQEFREAGILTADGHGISDLQDLKRVPADDRTRVAKRFVRTYSQMAAGQGFVTGLGGLITLPATVPADAAAYVGWLVRTASAVQLCYGIETRTETGDAQLKIALLAGAGVSSVTVKGSEMLVASLAKKAMVTPYAHAPVQAAVKALAARVGIQLTHKSFAKAVPVLGGAINGSVHGGLVYAGGRRLLAHYKDTVTPGRT